MERVRNILSFDWVCWRPWGRPEECATSSRSGRDLVSARTQQSTVGQKLPAHVLALLDDATSNDEEAAKAYNPDEERGEDGRWGSGGGDKLAGSEYPKGELPKWLSPEHMREDVKEAIETHPRSPEEQAKQIAIVSDFMKNSTPAIRCSDSVLQKILADGQFKNGSQVGSNRMGGNLAAQRKAAEADKLGIPEGTRFANRPIYGYMENPDAPVGLEKIYGNVIVELKSDILDRATVTWGDSLTNSWVGVPAQAALAGDPRLPVDAFINPASTQTQPDPYMEIQPLRTTTSDIARVRFTTDQPSPELSASLEKAGISWYYQPKQSG